MDELHRLMRETRRNRGWTRAQLAELASNGGDLEITDEQVKYVEIGCQRPPKPEVLKALAAALSLPWPMVRAAAGYE